MDGGGRRVEVVADSRSRTAWKKKKQDEEEQIDVVLELDPVLFSVGIDISPVILSLSSARISFDEKGNEAEDHYQGILGVRITESKDDLDQSAHLEHIALETALKYIAELKLHSIEQEFGSLGIDLLFSRRSK